MEELLEYIDIRNIITQYVLFKPKSKKELQKAVSLWCKNKEKALNK